MHLVVLSPVPLGTGSRCLVAKLSSSPQPPAPALWSATSQHQNSGRGQAAAYQLALESLETPISTWAVHYPGPVGARGCRATVFKRLYLLMPSPASVHRCVHTLKCCHPENPSDSWLRGDTHPVPTRGACYAQGAQESSLFLRCCTHAGEQTRGCFQMCKHEGVGMRVELL